jgi:UDP-N-acetylglucosamine:LPS N-acetylglucosamine transferase
MTSLTPALSRQDPTAFLPREPDARVLLVGSSGGHLAQLLALHAYWADLTRAWVTFDTPDAKDKLSGETDVTWAHWPTTRNLPNLARNTRLAAGVVARFRPTVVVSTGAAVALPFFVIGKKAGATTVFIEVNDRVETSTLSGRLCRPVTDLMLVQWQEQARLYRDAVVIGPLL